MPTTAPASKRQFPLHVHISVMFTLLLIVLGVTLGIFNYLQTTRIILNSSQQLFQQIERDVQQDLQHTYQPIRHALRLLALNANTGIEGSESRMALLEPFVQTLKDNPSLAALYLGDAQGNFFLVRPLRSQAAKDRLSAPSSATYEAWNIQRSGQDAAPLSRHFFYDDSLSLVGQRDKPDESYDPRQRSWFIPARGIHDEITTSPLSVFLHPRGGYDGVQTRLRKSRHRRRPDPLAIVRHTRPTQSHAPHRNSLVRSGQHCDCLP